MKGKVGQTLYLDTYKKIKEFLKQQEDFVYKSEIYYKLRVSNNSINVALAELESENLLEKDNQNKIKIKKEKDADNQ